jgi:hypothetical protein
MEVWWRLYLHHTDFHTRVLDAGICELLGGA